MKSMFWGKIIPAAILWIAAGYLNLSHAMDKYSKYSVQADLTASSVQDTILPKKIKVSTASQLKSAVTSLNPGDTLEVMDGTYDLNSYLNITRSGTKTAPIIIRAARTGGVTFINKSAFDFKSVSYVNLEGFIFTSKDVTAVKLESCNNIRITRNVFRLQETASLKWIVIGGTSGQAEPNSFDNRIDHNLFEEKHQLGNFITIDGSSDPLYKSSQHDIIDHNHFRNNSPRADNGQESIRVGWSRMSMSDGFTVVEYNLFENCDGDPEIISVKTCRDTLRYNTIQSSMGTLCLRHGNGSVVEGNFFFGNGREGTGGIRVYGDDHKIFNNYFEGLTGSRWDAPITVTNGDADYPGTDLTKHFRPRRGVYAFNTLVNNTYGIQIGYNSAGSYTKPPSDNIFACNLITGSQNQMLLYNTVPVNQTLISNVIWPTGSATAGISYDSLQIKSIDPKLIRSDGLYRLSAQSALINASKAEYTFIKIDIDGQERIPPWDIGADEFIQGGTIKRKPLTKADVGPEAGDITSVFDERNRILPSSAILLQNYPNPFNSSTRIEFILQQSAYVKLKLFELTGKQIAMLIDGEKSAGRHSYLLNTEGLPSGIYFYTLSSSSSPAETRKLILLK